METISRWIVTYLANSLWMTCAVAAIVILLDRLLRRSGPRYRHPLWVLSLVLAAFLPLLTFVGRNSQVTMLESSLSTQPATEAVTNANRTQTSWMRLGHHPASLPAMPIVEYLVTGAYFGFLALQFGKLARMWRQTRTIVAEASTCELTPEFDEILQHACCASHLPPVAVMSSPQVTGPVTVGWHKPAIILSNGFLLHASTEEFRSMISHEIAHIRRNDFALNLWCHILALPISFHPVAAWILSRIDQSREMACDELAVSYIGNSATYARALLNLARSIHAVANARFECALGLFDSNSLEERVTNVLDRTNRFGRNAGRTVLTLSAVLLLTMCAALSGFSLQVDRNSAAGSQLDRYVGTWVAKFHGKVFLTLKLDEKDGVLTGSGSGSRINSDDNGQLTDAEQVEGEGGKVVHAKVENGVLHFTTHSKGQDGAGDDDIDFTMKLTGQNEGELQVVTPPGIAALKPWRIERVSDKK